VDALEVGAGQSLVERLHGLERDYAIVGHTDDDVILQAFDVHDVGEVDAY